MAPTHTADFSVLVSQRLAKPPFICLINKGPHIGAEWHTHTHKLGNEGTILGRHLAEEVTGLLGTLGGHADVYIHPLDSTHDSFYGSLWPVYLLITYCALFCCSPSALLVM